MGSLRILLAVAVCFYHTTPVGPFAWISGITAVYVFFVISGFYIQMVLDTRYTAARLGESWVQRFYIARYLRLFPAYAAAALCVLGFAVFVLSSTGTLVRPLEGWAALSGSLKGSIYSAGVMFANITMVGLNVPSVGYLAIGPSWSLGVELSFYLLAPFLLVRSDRFLAVVITIGILLKAVPFNTHVPAFVGIDCFLLGALAYRKKDLLTVTFRWPRFQQAVVFVCVFLLVAFALPHSKTAYIANTHLHPDTLIYPLLFALLIPTIYASTSGNRFDRAIGEISYPFYIFHELVIVILSGEFGLLQLSGERLAVSVTAVTLLIAFFVVRIESRWIEPRRARLSKPAPVSAASAKNYSEDSVCSA